VTGIRRFDWMSAFAGMTSNWRLVPKPWRLAIDFFGVRAYNLTVSIARSAREDLTGQNSPSPMVMQAKVKTSPTPVKFGVLRGVETMQAQ
jgi:hypothetical protein